MHAWDTAVLAGMVRGSWCKGSRGTLLLTLVPHAGLQLYGQARCAGPCAVFSAEVGTHSVDVFIKPAPSFVDQVRRPKTGVEKNSKRSSTHR